MLLSIAVFTDFWEALSPYICVINVLFCWDRLVKKVVQGAYNVLNSVCRLKWRLIKIQSAAFFASWLSFHHCVLFWASFCTLGGNKGKPSFMRKESNRVSTINEPCKSNYCINREGKFSGKWSKCFWSWMNGLLEPVEQKPVKVC